MKKLIILSLTIWVSVNLFSQTLNLQFGSHFIPDKVLFDKPLTSSPRPFVYAGLSYTHDTGVNVGVTFTPDLNIISLNTTVPIFAFKKRRSNWNFALVNNCKND